MKSKKLSNLIENLDKNSTELLELAVSGTHTPIKYHIQDLEYTKQFLMNVQDLWLSFQNEAKNKFRPKGKVLFVLSANEPFIVTFIPVIHALFAGNEVHIKPASINAQFVTRAISIITESVPEWKEKLFVHDAVPREEFENFVLQQRFDFVHWFGSTQVIKSVAPFFGRQMIDFNPECEGNDVIFVDKSADLDDAVRVVVHSLVRHNGQCCNAIKGIFVHKAVENKFSEKLQSQVSKIIVGESDTESTDVSRSQYAVSLESFTQQHDLTKKVATVYKPPTVEEIAPAVLHLSGYSKSLLQSCSFMPLQWLVGVNSVQEVVNHVNAGAYGLGITIFSSDKQSIDAVINTATVARININTDPLEVEYTEPWGGIKSSGFGGVSSWFEKFINYIFISR